MNQQQIPINQHWVPRSYLKYFATPETKSTDVPKAWRFEKETNVFDESPTAVRNLCGKRYLYSPKDSDGKRDPITENFLRDIENEAAVIWSALVDGELDLEDPSIRFTVAKFVAALQLRNYNLYTLLDSAVGLANKLYPLAEGALRSDGIDPRNAGKVFVHQLHNGLPKMTDYFMTRAWCVMTAPNDVFITSDKPVLFLHDTKMPGPGTAGAVPVFPLSPRRLLFMGEAEAFSANVYRSIEIPLALAINRNMLHRCYRIVITGRSPTDVSRELGGIST